MNVNLNKKKELWRNSSLRSSGLCIFFLLFSLIGCKDDDCTFFTGESEDGVLLGAGITELSRATDAGFEVGDTLGVFAVKWKSDMEQDSLLSIGNYADNVWFRLESMDNNWIPERMIYFPNDECLLDLYAYYPYRTQTFDVGPVVPVSVAVNQSVGNYYTRSDFMVAKTESVKRTREKVPLTFSHMLAQMNFILKPGIGFSVDDLLAAKIKVVNAIIDGSFDLSDIPEGEVVAGTRRFDVIPAGSWSKVGSVLTGKRAIMIPQELTSQTYIEVNLGTRRFTYKPSSVQLNPGCSRMFVITVNNTGLDITTQINPWDNCPPVNGEADEEEVPIVVMNTLSSIVKFTIEYEEDLLIDWGDGIIDTNIFDHTYGDGLASHEIKFYGNTRMLKLLMCQNNQLTSLKVDYNDYLLRLLCDSNQLTALDVSKNARLKYLSCENNQIKSLNLGDTCLLNVLYCSSNQITSLILDNCANLLFFHCDNNFLTSLDLSGNNKLNWLSCSNNYLASLDLSNNFEITQVRCNNNPFVTNQDTLVAIANTLPDLTGEIGGKLSVGNSVSAGWIQSICDAKNWELDGE